MMIISLKKRKLLISLKTLKEFFIVILDSMQMSITMKNSLIKYRGQIGLHLFEDRLTPYPLTLFVVAEKSLLIKDSLGEDLKGKIIRSFK